MEGNAAATEASSSGASQYKWRKCDNFWTEIIPKLSAISTVVNNLRGGDGNIDVIYD
ncbi:unnamed protein product [Dovyalis caffra]|uniref:Uncharacterized protein n=1 Tax=Dovyalis caffra TaxID=77055 RepID=A0AAV1SDU6_9ROSI|nr:unnamed protein product [Dovyalis caffra]